MDGGFASVVLEELLLLKFHGLTIFSAAFGSQRGLWVASRKAETLFVIAAGRPQLACKYRNEYIIIDFVSLTHGQSIVQTQSKASKMKELDVCVSRAVLSHVVEQYFCSSTVAPSGPRRPIPTP